MLQLKNILLSNGYANYPYQYYQYNQYNKYSNGGNGCNNRNNKKFILLICGLYFCYKISRK